MNEKNACLSHGVFLIKHLSSNVCVVKYYFKKIIHGQYLSGRLILTVDVVLSMVASFITILAVGVFFPTFFSPLVVLRYTVLSAVASLASFLVLKTYRSVIRHMMLREISLFVTVALLKVIPLWFYLEYGTGVIVGQGLLVAVMDFLLTVFLLLSLRVALQWVYAVIKNKAKVRRNSPCMLVYGTDEKAVSLISRLQNSSRYRIVGFLSPVKSSRLLQIGGLPVFHCGTTEAMEKALASGSADGIIFAHRDDARQEEGRLLGYCRRHGLSMLYAPTLGDVNEKGNRPVRKIKIEDLLERDEINISLEGIKDNFKDKVVMVTGAAGSIGSELCRQLATFGIKELVLFDNAETPVHNLRLELEDSFPQLHFAPIVGDVREQPRLEFVFSRFTPQVVFHAAAYKHVPLMEENPCEAVNVNVLGTRNVAGKCLEYGVEKMVMISTDKAVNPTNIMGCTKRLAEIYVQSLGIAIEKGEMQGKTKFVTTRFGNVLGSNGSVIPRFTEQIDHGGPVTVTHPDITRFFMTIPEACKLVMEAATMSNGNQIFVFDMGKSVKIAHLAERMIQLAGFEPGKDIKIKYTGLRPGEKLYEEVLSNEENTMPTGHSRIRVAKVRNYDYNDAVHAVSRLHELAVEVKIPEMVRYMKEVVPEYKSKNSPFEKYDRK